MRTGGANLPTLAQSDLVPQDYLSSLLRFEELRHKNKNNPEYDNLFFEGNSIPFGYPAVNCEIRDSVHQSRPDGLQTSLSHPLNAEFQFLFPPLQLPMAMKCNGKHLVSSNCMFL